MEGGVRTVGPPGQRAADGPQPPAPPPPQTAYQQRITSSTTSSGSGASPVHRPVDTPQSYSKGLLPSVQSSTPSSRSAASPLSPPRPGPGAPPTTYPPFPAREAPPTRYLQQTTHYGTAYRENPYARIPPNEYRVSAVVSSSGGAGVVSSNGGSTITANNAMPPAGSMENAGSFSSGGGGSSSGSKYNNSSSSSINNNINLPPPRSTVVGLVGQQQQQQQQQHHQSNLPTQPSGALVIEASGVGGGSMANAGPMRPRISLLPQPPPQPMDYEYGRHPGVQQQQSQPPPQMHKPMSHQQPQPPPSKTLLAVHSSDLGGPPMTKKIRLTGMDNHQQHMHHHQQAQPPAQHLQPVSGGIIEFSKTPPPLKVDTREPASQQMTSSGGGAYHPLVEAISPTLPPDPQDDWRAMKDDLLQKIAKVDSDIQKVEKQIMNLKNEEASLKEASAAASKPPAAEEATEVQSKHRSLAQIIYADNRRKASLAHAVLLSLGPPIELPLYNQPSDTDVCRAIIEKHGKFKQRLVLHLQMMKAARMERNTAFADVYAAKSQEWQRRVEKTESTAKRKAKEAKNREFFEKVFPELRKQREDKERFNRVGSRVKSEADLEEIMDGLQEQALEDKKMRSYAVIPPLMLDSEQKKYPFMNENGLLTDIVAEAKDREHLNVWTAGEKEIFKEKYLQHPKNFSAIAVNLDRKSVSDCVKFYYLSKKTENYKQLLRKARQRTRSSRNPQKSAPAQAPCIVDAMTTGVTTRLQREQQQKTGGRDRAANSASNNNNSTTTTTCNNASSSTSTTSSSNSNSSMNNPVSTNNITVSTASTTIMNNSNHHNSSSSSSSSSGSNSNHSNTSGPPGASFSYNATATPPIGDSTAPPPPASSTSTASTVATTKLASTSSPVTITTNASPLSTAAEPVPSGGANPSPPGMHSSSNSFAEATQQQLTIGTNSNVEHKPSLNHCDIGNVDRNTNNIADGTGSTKGVNPTVDVKHHLKPMPSGGMEFPKRMKLNSPSEDVQKLPQFTQDGMVAVKKEDGSERACAVCRTQSGPMIYLEKGRGHLYGIHEEAFIAGSYACHDCEIDMRSWRPSNSLSEKSYPMCPLPKCVNKLRRKRFRNIPARLYDLAADIREPVLRDFQIPNGAKECCEMCVSKIRKRIKMHLKPSLLTGREYSSMDGENTDWSTSDDEPEGASDTASAESPNNPTPNPPSSVLMVPQKEEILAMNSAVPPNIHKSVDDDRLMPPHGYLPKKHKISEECDSSATETADEENESSPANRHSPKGHLQFGNQTTITMVPSHTLSGLHHHHHHHMNGPMRETPRTVRDVISNVIERGLKGPSIVPPPMLNSLPTGMKSLMGGGGNDAMMRDLSRPGEGPLKQPQQQGPRGGGGGSSHVNHVMENSLATLSVVNPHQQGLMPGVHSIPEGSLMASSMSSAQGPGPNQVLSSHGLQNQIAATITPVPLTAGSSGPGQQQQQPSQPSSLQIIPAGMDPKGNDNSVSVRMPLGPPPPGSQQPGGGGGADAEPQILDFSIKKRDSNSGAFPPPKSIHNSTTIYRNENTMQPMYVPPESYPNYRLSKSPINIPMQARRGQPQPQQPGPLPPNQHQQQHHQMMMQHHQQQQQQQQQQHHHQQQLNKLKVAPKLSPKQMASNNSPLGGGNSGPKAVGSITHGTPMNSLGPQATMLIQGGTMLIQGVDGMTRRTPPDSGGSKIGSITQGTPLHMVPMHIQVQENMRKQLEQQQQQQQQQNPQHPPTARSPYEGPPSNSRQSPAYPQGPPPPGSVYARSPGMPPYSGHEAQQWSSRQILTNDYLTSQQMHRGGGNTPVMGSGRSDKESPSPRSVMISTGGPPPPPQGSGYYEKDQRSASRESLMSRSSPAAERMLHGSPSPMRTPPPPQRQGVIQRHNTVGLGGTPTSSQGGVSLSKPPSPASNRIHVMSHYPLPGHEALSSLVDVAVQQPLLPVPHKDDKSGRNPTPTEQMIAFQQMRQLEMQRRPGGIPPPQQMFLREHQMQYDHLREMEHKQREQRERDHMAEREREQRERDRQERERSILAERDRNIQAERERSMQVERDRERLSNNARSLYDEEERRRYGNSGQPPFIRESRPGGPPMRVVDGDSLTAANLIDAIITHQITHSNSDSPLAGRELHRPNYYSLREHQQAQQHQQQQQGPHHPHPMLGGPPAGAVENNGKSQSPHVIKIDLDSDSSSGAIPQPPSRPSPAGVKNITIGQITDSVIAKDFASNSLLSLRPPYGSAAAHHPDQSPVSMGAPPDHQWARRLPPGLSGAVPSHVVGGPPIGSQQMQQQQQKEQGKEMGRVPTPDERQIIRMAQTPSPRSKSGGPGVPMHEPVSPPEVSSGPPPPTSLASHYYSAVGQTLISLQPPHGGGGPERRPNSGPPPPMGGMPPTSSHQTNFALDCYVKNRIVEAMRIQEESGRTEEAYGGGGEKGERQSHGATSAAGSNNNHHERSITPGNNNMAVTTDRGDEEMGNRPSSKPGGGASAYGGGASNPPVSTTYAYPFSALNVSGAPPVNHVPQPPTSVAHKPEGGGGGAVGGGVVGGVGLPPGGLSVGGGGGPPSEPKPLLSSQYEALSDEDENPEGRN